LETVWHVAHSSLEAWKGDLTVRWGIAPEPSPYGPRTTLAPSATIIALPGPGGMCWASVGASSENGSTKLWQTSHDTPCMSSRFSWEPSAALDRPSSHPRGEWHRTQNSPTPGTSWLAMAKLARKTGSRAAWAIIPPCQEKNGSAGPLGVPEWHMMHCCTLANSIPPSSGCVPGRNTCARAPIGAASIVTVVTMRTRTRFMRSFSLPKGPWAAVRIACGGRALGHG
jgi:hypothetical protein